ncbi:hypothetical protein ACEQ8H_002455 [Pleosporales sp. CAS-2024a]
MQVLVLAKQRVEKQKEKCKKWIKKVFGCCFEQRTEEEEEEDIKGDHAHARAASHSIATTGFPYAQAPSGVLPETPSHTPSSSSPARESESESVPTPAPAPASQQHQHHVPAPLTISSFGSAAASGTTSPSSSSVYSTTSSGRHIPIPIPAPAPALHMPSAPSAASQSPTPSALDGVFVDFSGVYWDPERDLHLDLDLNLDWDWDWDWDGNRLPSSGTGTGTRAPQIAPLRPVSSLIEGWARTSAETDARVLAAGEGVTTPPEMASSSSSSSSPPGLSLAGLSASPTPSPSPEPDWPTRHADTPCPAEKRPRESGSWWSFDLVAPDSAFAVMRMRGNAARRRRGWYGTTWIDESDPEDV